MKAIVHIGTEKTGTQSIQQFLYQNRRKLSRHGYHFLQSAGTTNNRALPTYCISDTRHDAVFRDLDIYTTEERAAYKAGFLREFEQELASLPASVHSVVISSEHFHSRLSTEEELDNLHALLTRYFDSIGIICYLREQVATCISSYSTSMKSGGTQSFAEFMRRCTPDNYYFNYYTMLSNWERCFGLDALNVGLFDSEHLLNGDLLDDFTARIDRGLLGKLNKSVTAANKSMSPGGQLLSLAVNRAFPLRTSSREVGRLRASCNKWISEHMRGRGQQPPLEEQLEVYSLFLDSNEKLRRKFFPQLNQLFAPPREQSLVEFDINVEFIEALAAVIKLIKKEGRDILDQTEYAAACAQILSNAFDTVNGEERADDDEAGNEAGKQIRFTSDDVRMLRHCARIVEKQSVASAMWLMQLAGRINPASRGIKERLSQYERKLASNAEKEPYLLTYFSAKELSDFDVVQQLSVEFNQWADSFDVAVGQSLQMLLNPHRLTPEGQVSPVSAGKPMGFSIISATSYDAAVELARDCPFLKFDVDVEISRVAYPLPGSKP